MKGYLSAKEAARKWSLSGRRVSQCIRDGRLSGMERFSKSRANPKDAVRPENQKTGVKKAVRAAEQFFLFAYMLE